MGKIRVEKKGRHQPGPSKARRVSLDGRKPLIAIAAQSKARVPDGCFNQCGANAARDVDD